jgi:hypothetical protein
MEHMMNRDELIKAKLQHSFHNSEIRSFESCRRRWDWVYREGYYPTVTPKPLEFGMAWHAAKQIWYDPDMWRKDREMMAAAAFAKFNVVVKQQLDYYKEVNGEPSDEVIQDYQERVDLGRRMLEYYTKEVSPKLDVGLTPLTVEIPFEVDLGLWCKCTRCWKKWLKHTTTMTPKEIVDSGNRSYELWEGLPVTYGGIIDAIFQDLEHRLLIVDWKTTTRIIADDTESSFLQLDTQVGRYPMALAKLGRPVDGFIYHEQRKAVPEPPQKLKRPYKGRLYSTDKNAPTELDLFIREVEANDPGYYHGIYNDYVAYLKSAEGPKFYQRHKIIKNRYEIENTWRDLLNEVKDMMENPRVYPMPSRFTCNHCAYKTPCIGKNMDEDYKYTLDTLYVKKELHYYEEDQYVQ